MTPDDTKKRDWRKKSARSTAAEDGAAAESAGERQSTDAPAAGTRLSAAEIHDNVLVAAKEEMRRPASELAWSSLAAGLTIGFSFLASAYLASWVPPRFASLAAAAGYPLGFILVVQARSQLFTENTLEPVIPLLHERTGDALLRVLRLWGIVLVGNLIGALLFGIVAARTGAVPEWLQPHLVTVATEATRGSFWDNAYRAVFGGWLVALMAWMVSSTRFTTSQVIYIWLTTASIAAFAFRHSIAGAVEAFYLAAGGFSSWSVMIGSFLVPALLGNIAGGVVLVALLNHGQAGGKRGTWAEPPKP